MNNQEIMQIAYRVYEELVRQYRENGRTDYEAGRVDGCLILVQELERFIPANQNPSYDHEEK